MSIIDEEVAISNLYELILKEFQPEDFSLKELKSYIENKLKIVKLEISKLNATQFIQQVKPFEINKYWGKLLK